MPHLAVTAANEFDHKALKCYLFLKSEASLKPDQNAGANLPVKAPIVKGFLCCPHDAQDSGTYQSFFWTFTCTDEVQRSCSGPLSDCDFVRNLTPEPDCP